MSDIEKISSWWHGYHIDHDHCSKKNITNIIILLLSLLPTFLYYWSVNNFLPDPPLDQFDQIDKLSQLSAVWNKDNFSWNELMYWSPLLLINFTFFINIDLGFWLLGLAQKSFWLIDPWWTLLPPVYGFLWASHPLATQNPRGIITLVLVIIWSIRLTHSYFRREDWKFGTREDWRYTKMAIQYGRPSWYFISFFTVGLAQHPMLVGISLPLYSVRFGPDSKKELGWLDYVAMVLCLVGILVAWVSDNQLREYMMENQRRRKVGEGIQQILDNGLWKYSRHPNYFGEQLWWWSFALFAVQCGQIWAIAGTFINTVVLCIVTDMTEKKVLQEWQPERAELFRKYQRKTSRCILWPPKKQEKVEDNYKDENIL